MDSRARQNFQPVLFAKKKGKKGTKLEQREKKIYSRDFGLFLLQTVVIPAS